MLPFELVVRGSTGRARDTRTERRQRARVVEKARAPT